MLVTASHSIDYLKIRPRPRQSMGLLLLLCKTSSALEDVTSILRYINVSILFYKTLESILDWAQCQLTKATRGPAVFFIILDTL